MRSSSWKYPFTIPETFASCAASSSAYLFRMALLTLAGTPCPALVLLQNIERRLRCLPFLQIVQVFKRLAISRLQRKRRGKALHGFGDSSARRLRCSPVVPAFTGGICFQRSAQFQRRFLKSVSLEQP